MLTSFDFKLNITAGRGYLTPSAGRTMRYIHIAACGIDGQALAFYVRQLDVSADRLNVNIAFSVDIINRNIPAC